MATRTKIFRRKGDPTRLDKRRLYDARRRETQPWRALYKTIQWARIRAAVLAQSPLCVRCERAGVLEPATVVNHVHRHGGDPVRFFAGPFEALCAPCHDGEVQREERAAERKPG